MLEANRYPVIKNNAFNKMHKHYSYSVSLLFLLIVKILGIESIQTHGDDGKISHHLCSGSITRNLNQQRASDLSASRQRPACLQRERTAYCLRLTHFLSALFISIHPFRIF